MNPQTSFDLAQAGFALAMSLISVTAVVVGMRSAIAVLRDQLKETSTDLKGLTLQVNKLATEMAIVKYASGIEGNGHKET